MKMSHPSSNVYLTSNVYNASFLRTAVQQYSTKPRKESKQKVLCALLYFPTYCSKVWLVQGMNTLREEILAGIKARGGVQGSKKQVWLITKSNLSWSYYFLRNRKIFVYDENMARQSSGVLLGPIQNIGG